MKKYCKQEAFGKKCLSVSHKSFIFTDLIHDEIEANINVRGGLVSTEEEKAGIIKNTVFGQLITTCYNMKEFKVRSDITTEVLISYAKQHELEDDLISVLEKTINE